MSIRLTDDETQLVRILLIAKLDGRPAVLAGEQRIASLRALQAKVDEHARREASPRKRPSIIVEDGALNHIRLYDMVQFMIAHGLEFVHKHPYLVVRRSGLSERRGTDTGRFASTDGPGGEGAETGQPIEYGDRVDGVFRCVDPTAMDPDSDDEEGAPLEDV